MKPALIDVGWKFEEELDDLFLVKEQYIPDSFLDQLADDRLNSKQRAGEFHKIAEIPTGVVEMWLKEGFDIFRETPRAIVRKLQKDGLEKFIATTKRV
jgi:hypothetical protein